MNAEYWTIKDGQLHAGEAVHTGHCDRDDADRGAKDLPARYHARVAKLQTMESDYPIEDPRYEPFPSARWCVVVREGGGP